MEKFLSVFKEKYYFYLVLILVVFIPIYPKLPLIGVGGTYVSIRAEDFFIFLTGLLWFVFYYKDLRKYLKQPIYQAFILFWSIGLLSLISAFTITYFIQPHLGILHWLRRIEYMSLFIIAATTIKSVDQIKLILKVFLAATVFIILYGFGQQWLRFPVISTTNKEFSKGLILFLSPEARVNSTFAGHYDLAVFLTFLLTMLAGYFIYFKKFYTKILIAVLGFFSFILLAMTAARVSFFAELAGITAVFWLSSQKKLILVLVFFAMLALVVSPDLRHRTVATLTVNLLGGGGAKYEPPPQMPGNTNKFSIENAATGAATPSGVPVDVAPGEPLNTTELGVYRSFEIRFNEEWPRAIRAFEKNIFLGTGYASITIATDNDYLRSLGEVGLLGTLSLCLIFFIIIKRMVRFIRKALKRLIYYLILGLFCGLLTIFITQTFIDVLESSKIAQLLWLSLGVGFAAMNLEERNG